jgi:hypothetical protein
MTTQSQDIIERLERASGPDRELDIAILKATDANGYLIEDDGTILVECDMGEGPGWFNIGYEVPTFTASIDSALTLVPANHDWSLHADNGEAIAGCMPSSEDGCDIADCPGATPAIALCIAALKAHASISSKEQVGS